MIGSIFGYFISGFIGFLIGVVMSCILLAQKNLKYKEKIENNVTDNFNNRLSMAKAAYKIYSMSPEERQAQFEESEEDETEVSED